MNATIPVDWRRIAIWSSCRSSTVAIWWSSSRSWEETGGVAAWGSVALVLLLLLLAGASRWYSPLVASWVLGTLLAATLPPFAVLQ